MSYFVLIFGGSTARRGFKGDLHVVPRAAGLCVPGSRQSLMVLSSVACRPSFVVRQSRQRHPVVPSSGTGSACGRSAHQQSCPGSQDIGALHSEQTVSMVDLQFRLRQTIAPRSNLSRTGDLTAAEIKPW